MKKLMIVGAAIVVGVAFAGEPKVEMPLPAGAKIIEVGGRSKIKTFEDALDRVAKYRRGNRKTPLALRVAPGDYIPSRPLVVTKEHASTNFAPLVVYAADFADKPRIHGGMPVKKWKKAKFNGRDDVWCADVSALNLKVRPNFLALNGKRLRFARWPNFDPKSPYTRGWTPADNRGEVFFEDELQIRPEDARTWAHPEDARVVAYPRHGYGTRTIDVKAVTNGVMRLACKRVKITNPLMKWNCWYVENVAEELDTPGEWHYDPRTRKVYLIPPEDADMKKALVTLGARRPVVKFDHCGNCTFAGIEVAGGAYRGIEIIECTGVALRACSVHDIGYDAIWMASAFVEVTDCDIHDVRGTGIFIHSHSLGRRVTDRMDSVIENNYIHDCRCGIFNCGQGMRISHNLIHDTLTSGISGYGRFNDISYNRIRHTCIMADDVGALYDSGWGSGCKTQIRYNWISDTIGHKFSGGKHQFFWDAACGIYFDECSGGADVYGNLVVRAHYAGMHLHCARWLNVSNNVFVSNAPIPTSMYSKQLSISDWGPWRERFGNRDLHVGEYNFMMKMDPAWAQFPSLSQDANTDAVFSDNGMMMMGNKFVNNIFYYPDQGGSGKMLNASALNLTTNFFNKNVYFPGRERDGRIKSVSMDTHRKEGLSYEAWLEAGQDADSIVGDPLFVDPKKGDYRLKPDSPALKLGFKELPYDKMGLKVTKFRPVLPVEAEGLREHPEWLTDEKGDYPHQTKKGKRTLDRK